MRKPFRAALLALSMIAAVAGCDVDGTVAKLNNLGSGRSNEVAAIGGGGRLGKTPETISIATFNIQVFGQAKLENPEVMKILVETVRRFDVVALQEIRSKQQDVLPRFVALLNADGAAYDFVLGPRLGRTNSTEQYAFVYDASRIEFLQGSDYTISDPQDLLHREPLVARFRARGVPSEEAFTFSLVNIHTDPEETDTELDVLDDALAAVRQNGSGEDDVILLGDFNVDEQHYGELGRVPGIQWAIHGQTTNTRQTEGYDNILFDGNRTSEFTGSAGVLNLMTEFGLSERDALDVSDHFPVWAVFEARERAGTLAGGRDGVVR